MTAFFDVREVSVHFGGVRALQDVSTSLSAGELCGLVGPNGSGKTTLLSVISGLVEPTHGWVELEGSRLRKADPTGAARAGVARTFQHIRLAPDHTVLENVMTGAGLAVRLQRKGWWTERARRRELHDRAYEVLARVGVDGWLAARLPNEIPYGHRRRVEIARALAMQPRMVLLDEPAAGMTPFGRSQLADLILAIAADGVAQILVEHDFALIGRVCPRVVVLDSGRVLADGAPHDVAQIPEVQEAYLGGGRTVATGA